MRFALTLALSILGLIAFVVFGAAPPAGGQTTTIVIGDNWYCEASFENGVCETTVNVGDSVDWQWVGAALHTTTECGGDLDVCPEPHRWDSPVQVVGTFAFVFDSPGTFVYRCQIHPTLMRGKITVLSAEQSTPTPPPAPTLTPPPAPSATPQPSSSPTSFPADVGESKGATSPPGPLPAGGGALKGETGPPMPWWLLLTSGGLLLAGVTLLAVRLVPGPHRPCRR